VTIRVARQTRTPPRVGDAKEAGSREPSCTGFRATAGGLRLANTVGARCLTRHLHALAIAPGLLEGVSPGECASAPLGGSFLPFQIYRLADRRGTE
jgi:hypothetical protein